jgi:hypothetical protein
VARFRFRDHLYRKEWQMKLVAWIYRPTVEDEQNAKKWSSDTRQVLPKLYEIKFRNPNDTPLSDNRYFIPGWKRAEWLDER